MRLAGRRLLQASALPMVPRALPRLAFPQTRALSTTLPMRVPPREAKPRPSWASRTAKENPFAPTPAPTATATAPPAAAEPTASAAPAASSTPAESGKPSRTLSTAASRSAATDHVYDATSTGTFDISKVIMDDDSSFRQQHYGRPQAELRLRPVLGRTVNLGGNLDLAGALGRVHSLVMRNKIKWAFHHQRQHERPGLKRKRLRSERWRKRFQTGFTETVKRVQELRSQGW